MSNKIDPFEVLLSQYKDRRHNISQELEALRCSVTQISLIVNAVKDHTDKTLLSLENNIRDKKGLEECVIELKESLQDLNAFIIEQPIRIDRGIIEYQAFEKEIIGFENAIKQLQSQYLIEVEEEERVFKKNNNTRKPGTRPRSLKSSRTNKNSNS